MHTDKNESIESAITEKIIGCAYTVSNTLGAGFLEKVYENALAIEFNKNSIQFKQQAPIKVMYRDIIVGEFVSDLIVESTVLVELKASKAIDDAHVAQCLNYLKATNIRFGLIINFGKPKVEIKRVVLGF